MKEGEMVKKKIQEDIRKGKNETEVSVPFSRFPLSKWLEWWNDCKKNFGECRWAKAWFDHQKAGEIKQYDALWEKLAEIEERLNNLTKPEAKETVKTLGGEEV